MAPYNAKARAAHPAAAPVASTSACPSVATSVASARSTAITTASPPPPSRPPRRSAAASAGASSAPPPLHRQVWAHPANEMNSIWVGERVATIKFEDILGNVIQRKDAPAWGPNAQFRYPLNGTGMIWDKVHAPP